MTRLMWTLRFGDMVIVCRPIDGTCPVETQAMIEHEVDLYGLGADAHVEVTALQGIHDGGR